MSKCQQQKFADKLKFSELQLKIDKLASSQATQGESPKNEILMINTASSPLALKTITIDSNKIERLEWKTTQTSPKTPTPMKKKATLENYIKEEIKAAIAAEMKAIQAHSHILNLTKQASMREAKIQTDEYKVSLCFFFYLGGGAFRMNQFFYAY